MVTLALTISCEHKEIVCPVSGEINVVFEWDHASDADVEGMTLLFYPLEGDGRTWRFDIAGKDGGPIMIPSGTYEMIAFNNDLPGIILGATESRSTLFASARRVADDKDCGIYASTGMLYCGEISRLELTPCGVRYVTASGTIKECGHRIVRCHPDSIATGYTVNLTRVTGMERIRSANVILRGIRSSILLESRLSSEIPAGLAIDMSRDTDNDTLSGQGYAFPPSDPMTAKYQLSLQMRLTDGKTVVREIDIKPENLNIITRHNVVITIDGIVIPDGDSSGDIGGIGAVVDGWEVIEIDLEPSL